MLGQPVRVDVRLTVKNPKSVDLVCAVSIFSFVFDIVVTVSGQAGSTTHSGSRRIGGHYIVTSALPNSPPTVCPQNLRLTALNLQGVQNDIDNWVRQQINASALVGNLPLPTIAKDGATWPSLR